MLFRAPVFLGLAGPAFGSVLVRRQASSLDSCPGYAASNVQDDGARVMADLTLAEPPCNVYGEDLTDLKLEVEYQSGESLYHSSGNWGEFQEVSNEHLESRLHVKIYDAEEQIYQVSESVFPRPSSEDVDPSDSALAFSWTESPFSFAVTRKSTNETLFDSSAASLVFESQYLRLRTGLPDSPHLYGLGEHTDPFQLNTTNYTRTVSKCNSTLWPNADVEQLWNRDAYGTPNGTNLYGDHPIYFDHRGSSGTHGVFLLNSNGMDIRIDNTDGQYLEYNALGGIIDLYFLAGPTPKDVSVQYAEVAGTPVMQPYWGKSRISSHLISSLTFLQVLVSISASMATEMCSWSRKLWPIIRKRIFRWRQVYHLESPEYADC